MKQATYFAAAILVGAAFVGCDKSSSSTTNTPPPTAEAPKSAAVAAMENATAKTQEMAAAGTAKAKEVAGEATAKANQVAADTTAALKTQAQDLYDKATAAIKANNFTGAQDLVAKLTDMKSKLPPEWQTKIDELKTMFDKAKVAASALPSLGR